MVDVGPLSATIPDLLRLLTVPVFAYLAYTDIQTRRVDNLTWVPLTALGVALLALDYQDAVAAGGREWRLFVITTTISVGFVVSMAYLFHFLGAFGGADARALMTMAVLYPTWPAITVAGTTFPIADPAPMRVFSFTILTNAVVWGIAYPGLLALRNTAMGQQGRRMFVGIPVRWDAIPTTHGKLLSDSDAGLGERLKGLLYPRQSGLDLDAVRMYLRWRGATLDEIRADPDRFRDPESLPDEPHDPTDGAVHLGPESTAENADVATDGGVDESEDAVADVTEDSPEEGELDEEMADPWGAAAFLDDIEGDAYGTSPDRLRDGLDRLVTEEELWVTPGIPFLVPVFFGLLVAFVYGDILIGALRALGLI
ncbi:A24 family peptidase C-terminal domain-containing protein [Haloarchaeobius sp. DYHT-AS-18]|uniref:A24 family peptidase C-terminal domain-containing protein n=1 Tax=Haloarchaeobius sp. DYHT-AS-18 TaxID=3446117 RepID=UPI003EBB32F5